MSALNLALAVFGNLVSWTLVVWLLARRRMAKAELVEVRVGEPALLAGWMTAYGIVARWNGVDDDGVDVWDALSADMAMPVGLRLSPTQMRKTPNGTPEWSPAAVGLIERELESRGYKRVDFEFERTKLMPGEDGFVRHGVVKDPERIVTDPERPVPASSMSSSSWKRTTAGPMTVHRQRVESPDTPPAIPCELDLDLAPDGPTDEATGRIGRWQIVDGSSVFIEAELGACGVTVKVSRHGPRVSLSRVVRGCEHVTTSRAVASTELPDTSATDWERIVWAVGWAERVLVLGAADSSTGETRVAAAGVDKRRPIKAPASRPCIPRERYSVATHCAVALLLAAGCGPSSIASSGGETGKTSNVH